MDIRNMPAGREMDALVAEKVMGLVVQKIHILAETKEYPGYEHTGKYEYDCQNYSTDIAEAWEVVERFGKHGYTVHIEWKGAGREFEYTAEVALVKSIYTIGHGVGTAPLAICRAALMAVGADKC